MCGGVGEGRYHPSFVPADFVSDDVNPGVVNPYFPPTIGYRWDYAGGAATDTIAALINAGTATPVFG